MLNPIVNDLPFADELKALSALPAASAFNELIVEPPNVVHSLPVVAVTHELDPWVPLAYSVPVPESAAIVVDVLGAATRLLKFQYAIRAAELLAGQAIIAIDPTVTQAQTRPARAFRAADLQEAASGVTMTVEKAAMVVTFLKRWKRLPM
jgi:hypothetical protein